VFTAGYGMIPYIKQITFRSLIFNNSTLCPHCIYVFCIYLKKKTATCATSAIKYLVFITELKGVYSAVRTGPLNKAVCASSLRLKVNR
jgi:hypothetical protein